MLNVGFNVLQERASTDDAMYDGRWVADVDKQEVVDAYSGWEGAFNTMLEVIQSLLQLSYPLTLSIASEYWKSPEMGGPHAEAVANLCRWSGSPAWRRREYTKFG